MVGRLQSVMAQFETFADATLFRQSMEPLVLRDPVGATMLIGALANHIAEPGPGEPPVQACLHDRDGPAAALMAFPGYPVQLLVDPMSFQYLVGAEIDYKEDLEGAQFVIRNPNASTTCGCGSSFSV